MSNQETIDLLRNTLAKALWHIEKGEDYKEISNEEMIKEIELVMEQTE
jgi:hypothetical protein